MAAPALPALGAASPGDWQTVFRCWMDTEGERRREAAERRRDRMSGDATREYEISAAGGRAAVMRGLERSAPDSLGTIALTKGAQLKKLCDTGESSREAAIAHVDRVVAHMRLPSEVAQRIRTLSMDYMYRFIQGYYDAGAEEGRERLAELRVKARAEKRHLTFADEQDALTNRRRIRWMDNKVMVVVAAVAGWCGWPVARARFYYELSPQRRRNGTTSIMRSTSSARAAVSRYVRLPPVDPTIVIPRLTKQVCSEMQVWAGICVRAVLVATAMGKVRAATHQVGTADVRRTPADDACSAVYSVYYATLARRSDLGQQAVLALTGAFHLSICDRMVCNPISVTVQGSVRAACPDKPRWGRFVERFAADSDGIDVATLCVLPKRA